MQFLDKKSELQDVNLQFMKKMSELWEKKWQLPLKVLFVARRNAKLHFLPIRLCFINVYYPNPL